MEEKESFILLIQTNSPGELTSWVKPMAEIFSKKKKNCNIQIFLTPCQYASGQEVSIAKKLPNVTRVYSPKDTLKHLYTGPLRYKKEKGAVLFLGGDPSYAKLIGIKHQLPVFGYAHSNQSLGLGIKRISKKDIGDLMADSVSEQAYIRSDILLKNHLPEADYTVFFCGSRPQHFNAFFPLICETIQHIRQSLPHFNPIINLSPFITDTDLHSVSKRPKYHRYYFSKSKLS
jgi:hypothetical protein